jgi:hypothetical protein
LLSTETYFQTISQSIWSSYWKILLFIHLLAQNVQTYFQTISQSIWSSYPKIPLFIHLLAQEQRPCWRCGSSQSCMQCESNKPILWCKTARGRALVCRERFFHPTKGQLNVFHDSFITNFFGSKIHFISHLRLSPI